MMIKIARPTANLYRPAPRPTSSSSPKPGGDVVSLTSSTLQDQLQAASRSKNEAAARIEQYRTTRNSEEKKASLLRGLALAGAGLAAAGLVAMTSGNPALGLTMFGGGAALGIHSAVSSSLHQSTAGMNSQLGKLAEENEFKSLVEESRLNSALQQAALQS